VRRLGDQGIAGTCLSVLGEEHPQVWTSTTLLTQIDIYVILSRMETLTILLHDPVDQLVEAEASRRRIGAATLCSGIVAEYFLARKNALPPVVGGGATVPEQANRADFHAFDVRSHFPHYPSRSVDLAQQFVDKALALPEIRVSQSLSGRGVAFEPNVVFIEYLQKRPPGGIGVSLYGEPSRHSNLKLLPGRNPNYSRIVIRTKEELSNVLPEIRRAYELKFR
jgi:hypothetical protein